MPAPCSAFTGANSLDELARACPELSTFAKLLATADNYGKWMLDCGKRCGTLQKLPRTVFLPVNVVSN